MSQVEIIETQAFGSHRLVLIDKQRLVWFTFARPWWALSSWLWWFLTPGPKKWVLVRQKDGKKVRIRAVRLSKDYNFIGFQE